MTRDELGIFNEKTKIIEEKMVAIRRTRYFIFSTYKRRRGRDKISRVISTICAYRKCCNTYKSKEQECFGERKFARGDENS